MCAGLYGSFSNLDGIVVPTCRLAVEFFKVDHSAIVFFDHDFRQGQVIAEYPDLHIVGLTIPVHDIPAEENLIIHKEPIVFHRALEELSLGSVREIFEQLDIRSILIVPIIIGDWVVGSFSLDSIGHEHAFTENDVRACQIFADQVTPAIKSALQVDQLEFIRRTTLAITASPMEREELLRVIVRDAITLLKAQGGGIYIYHPEREELVVEADSGRVEGMSILEQKLRLGEGMAGRIVQDNLPFMIVNDYSTWEDRSTSYTVQNPFGAVIEVPLRWQQQMLGVLYVDDAVGRKFFLEDVYKLQLLADHATIALINAELMDRVSHVHHTTQMIAAISVSEDLQSVLAAISEGIKNVLPCHAVSCHVFDRVRKEVRFPPAMSGVLYPENVLEFGPFAHHSIVYRVIEEFSEPYYTSDTLHDKRMRSSFTEREQFVASAGIPLRVKGQPVGALFVNYREPHIFTEGEKKDIEAFAYQAAMAIDNALQYEQLRETHNIVRRSLVQEWLGFINSAWRHEIDKYATTIRYEVEALQILTSEYEDSSIGQKLNKIDRLAQQISSQPLITLPVWDEDTVESVLINALLRERLRQLWSREPFKSVEKRQDFQLHDGASVRASPDWLRRAIDLVAENAVRAMTDRPVKRLVVATDEQQGQARIRFTDSGGGIPDDVRRDLFVKPIHKYQGEKGGGIDLLIVQNIIETYDGHIYIASTGLEGTTLIIELPLEQSPIRGE